MSIMPAGQTDNTIGKRYLQEKDEENAQKHAQSSASGGTYYYGLTSTLADGATAVKEGNTNALKNHSGGDPLKAGFKFLNADKDTIQTYIKQNKINEKV